MEGFMTLSEFTKKVQENPEIAAAFKNAANGEQKSAVLNQYFPDLTRENLEGFQKQIAELDDSALDAVAGGFSQSAEDMFVSINLSSFICEYLTLEPTTTTLRAKRGRD
jgi:hypothetical protein